MKREKIDNRMEHQLLIGLITSTEFLSLSYVALKEELDTLHDSPLFYLIADWCLLHFEEYGKAPLEQIETIFDGWRHTESIDDELADSVEDFLSGISEEYAEQKDELNVPFLRDTLAKFLTKKKLKALSEELESYLARGQVEQASGAIADFRSVKLDMAEGVSLNSRETLQEAFSETVEPIISFGGAAGRFFNCALTRDALVGIQAPEKRGKTWWLIELAMQALRSRRKVAFFQVGDLSKNQLVRRFGVRFAKAPLDERECGKIEYPTKIKRDDDEELGVEIHTDHHFAKRPLSKKMMELGRDQFYAGVGISSEKDYLLISVHPNSSINVRGISTILDKWKIERSFIPDVIIIDYADILAPEEKKKDEREQINETWKALRRLSQERHALVLVPTQANTASYDAKLQTMKHFSNDKRKFAHVTGMFALNQTPEEKEEQIMRLNWIVLREASFNIRRCLYVGQCFTLGRAMTCASF